MHPLARSLALSIASRTAILQPYIRKGWLAQIWPINKTQVTVHLPFFHGENEYLFTIPSCK
jgi:hypothetical protein